MKSKRAKPITWPEFDAKLEAHKKDIIQAFDQFVEKILRLYHLDELADNFRRDAAGAQKDAISHRQDNVTEHDPRIVALKWR